MPREKKHQHERIRDWMLAQNDGKTLAEIRAALGYPEPSISAELRSLRKAQFGSYRVQKRRRYSGSKPAWEYRVLPHVEISRTSETALVTREAALAPIRPIASRQAVLARIVRDRVDEIMAERGAQLEPDFQPKEVSFEIQRRQTVFDRQKWALYFEKWGCRRCGKKTFGHASSGHCSGCLKTLANRQRQIKLEYERNNPEAEIERNIDHLTSRIRSAQALLGEGEK